MGTWVKVDGRRREKPTLKEIKEWKVLAKVAASALGGPLTTAIQETVQSRAAGAELNKHASRTSPENLSLRVYNKLNEHWRDPIKGSKIPLYTLKRKNIPVEAYSAKRFKVKAEEGIPLTSKERQQRAISAFLKRE